MLILRPYIINTCSPKMPPLETMSVACLNFLRFYCIQETRDNLPKTMVKREENNLGQSCSLWGTYTMFTSKGLPDTLRTM